MIHITFEVVMNSKISQMIYIFTKYTPILSKLKIPKLVTYEYIFGTLNKQLNGIPSLMKIEAKRKHWKNHLLPGGVCSSQDLGNYGV